MASKPQLDAGQSVAVVEADAFDRMNETKELIAQRAYEIYESRGGAHGSDRDDWFTAEGEVLPKLDVELRVTDGAAEFTAQIPGFRAKDLEVEVGHRLAVVLGIHPDSKLTADGVPKKKKVMRIIELPFDVDPASAAAKLQGGILRVVLPRLQ